MRTASDADLAICGFPPEPINRQFGCRDHPRNVSRHHYASLEIFIPLPVSRYPMTVWLDLIHHPGNRFLDH